MSNKYTYHDIPRFKQEFIDAKELAKTPNELLDTLQSNHKSRIAEIEASFQRDNAEVIENARLANNLVAIAEEDLRELVVEFYEVTKNKTYDNNLSVQVRTKAKYAIDKAVQWAETNAPVMIQKTIDKKAFESLPSIEDLDFVTIEESVSSAIKGL